MYLWYEGVSKDNNLCYWLPRPLLPGGLVSGYAVDQPPTATRGAARRLVLSTINLLSLIQLCRTQSCNGGCLLG